MSGFFVSIEFVPAVKNTTNMASRQLYRARNIKVYKDRTFYDICSVCGSFMWLNFNLCTNKSDFSFPKDIYETAGL